MNQLTAKKIVSKLEDGSTYQATEILIDGESLIDRVRRYEAPLAEKEGHPKLAAAYSWPAASHRLRDELLSETEDEKKVAVLECTCGVPGCWPLRMKIEVGASQVVWSEFEQPHRSEESAAGYWSYEGFGPFVFAKSEYESALQGIA